jgi:hypothetical protein
MFNVVPCEPEHLDQLATLFTAHAACVFPGAAVAPASIAARLDRDAGEFVTGPWVTERETLVALDRDRVVAGGQFLRYAADNRVSDTYRDAAEMRWLCFWPSDRDAAAALLDEAIARAAGATAFRVSGGLPGVLVYGVPDAWSHVEELVLGRGIERDGGRDEVLLVGRLNALSSPEAPPADCTLVPGVSWSGDAVLTAERRGAPVARMELSTDLTDRGRNPSQKGAGALWGPFADAEQPVPEIARWLWLESLEWLWLAGCDRVVAALLEGEPAVDQAIALGLRPVARLRRGHRLRR